MNFFVIQWPDWQSSVLMNCMSIFFFLQKKQTQLQPVLGMARKQLLGLVVTVTDILIDKVIVTVFNWPRSTLHWFPTKIFTWCKLYGQRKKISTICWPTQKTFCELGQNVTQYKNNCFSLPEWVCLKLWSLINLS